LPCQLSFDFMPHEAEALTPWAQAGMCRSSYYTRRKLQRAVSLAVELTRRQLQRTPPESFASAARGAPARTPRPFLPSHAEANELRLIARRVERLTISHRWLEQFFEDRSQLAHELRGIAARARPQGVNGQCKNVPPSSFTKSR
jgi:hypothetical protein